MFQFRSKSSGKSGKKLIDFKRCLNEEFSDEIKELKGDVEMFSQCFTFLDQEDYFKCEA